MHYIANFYHFFRVEAPEALLTDLEKFAADHEMYGLVILAPEGINATVSAKTKSRLEDFKAWMSARIEQPLVFKEASSEQAPFRRFKVKLREEIVTLGTPELFPGGQKNHHLSPTEWNQVLKEESDYVLIDTRNWYETKIGTFTGAVNPKTDQFTEFPAFMEKNNFSKDKKTLIFCTGGIRCEKGILELQRQGYNNVFQLEGGILKYLEEYPEDQFKGECFVFDHRVAVDQKLQPTKNYGLCPHCGQPAQTEITCQRCESLALICEDCQQKQWMQITCSKNCAFQLERHPDRKGPKQNSVRY